MEYDIRVKVSGSLGWPANLWTLWCNGKIICILYIYILYTWLNTFKTSPHQLPERFIYTFNKTYTKLQVFQSNRSADRTIAFPVPGGRRVEASGVEKPEKLHREIFPPQKNRPSLVIIMVIWEILMININNNGY